MNSLQNCENQKEFINYINFQPLCDVTEFFFNSPRYRYIITDVFCFVF